MTTVVSVKMIYLSLALFLACNSNFVFSQTYPFREYSVLDGLPQSQVSIVLQDSRKFLWIVTKNGLSRFDGNQFINYFRKDGLPSNAVNNVIEDTCGNIWALCKEGFSRYNGYGFDFNPLPSELKDCLFSAIATIDNQNNIFLIPDFPENISGRHPDSDNS